MPFNQLMTSDAGPDDDKKSEEFGRGHRLLFVINDGGFFLSHRLAIGQAAQRAGFEVLVACPECHGSARIRALGFQCITLKFDRWSRGLGAQLSTLRELCTLYRNVRPSIVHHVTIKPVLLGSLAARLAGVPAVINAISGLGFVFVARGVRAALRRAMVQILYRSALRHPNQRTIFQNPDDLELFIERNLTQRAATLLIRGSGVDSDLFAFTPEPVPPLQILLPARLLQDKGIAEFVDAAQFLRERGVKARFIVAGDIPHGNPAAISAADLSRWSKNGSVEFVGYSADMRTLLEQSHIVCLPSYREGLPLALLEAACVGRAIVASDVPGCREIVQNEVNGILVPPRSAIHLAEALATLIEDPELRNRMAVNGRRLVTQGGFDRDSVVRQHLMLYRQMLGAKLN